MYHILRRWDGLYTVSQALLLFSVLYGMADCALGTVFCSWVPDVHTFCPMSQAISSPYLTINAYRDTTPCLRVLICRRGRGRNPVPSGDQNRDLTLHLLVSAFVSYP